MKMDKMSSQPSFIYYGLANIQKSCIIYLNKTYTLTKKGSRRYMENSKINRTWLGITVIFLLFIFQQFASKIGSLVADSFNYSTIDEYDVFARISVHHIVQMLIGLLAIIILSKIYSIDFGFHFGNKNLGIKSVKIFSIAILIYTVILYLFGYFTNNIPRYGYPLNLKNVLGSLGFQLFLSGPSEEVLFRALPISIITYFINSDKERKIDKRNISSVSIVCAILFSVAHIRWTINPFSISMDYFQLIYSLILGIIYGNVYQKSRSVIYPMIMHSIGNVIMVGFWIIFEFVSK